MKIKDSLALDASGLSRSSDGYLVGKARVSKAGNVQQYLGREIGLTGDDANKVFGVYRDPEVVFDEDSMASLAGRPVTRNHPPEGVNADSWKALSVGAMGGRVVRDGEHVVASMAIMDSKAAEEVERGARSLSAGYTVNVVKDSGTAQDGTPYQYRQAGPLRFNHVAYLPDNNPRAGDTRIGDGFHSWGDAPTQDDHSGGNSPATPTGGLMPDSQLKTVVLGDAAIQLSVADVSAFEKFKADTAQALKDAEAAKDAAEAKADKLSEDKAALEARVSDEAIAERVKAVHDARHAAGKLAGDKFECDSLDPLTIKRAALTVARPSMDWAQKSDEYVTAAFDMSYEEKAKADEDEDKRTQGAKDSLNQFGKDFSDANPTEDGLATIDAAYEKAQARKRNAYKEAN